MIFLGWLLLAAIAVVAYALGRVHERDIAETSATDAAETLRILRRPDVTVTDGGWFDGRDHTALIADDHDTGRHTWPRVPGTCAQVAAWAGDTREWAIRRHHYISDDRLEDAIL